MSGTIGGKFSTSSTLSKLSRMELPATISANLLEPFPVREGNVNVSLDAKATARDRHFTQSLALLETADYAQGSKTSLNGKPAPHLTESDRINVTGAWSENGLFSSSLSELFIRKSRPSLFSLPQLCSSSFYETTLIIMSQTSLMFNFVSDCGFL